MTCMYFTSIHAFICTCISTGKSKLVGDHIDEINEDLGVIHRCTEPKIHEALLKLFHEKWAAEGEHDFLAYFKAQWEGKAWSRAQAPIGHATDNNTIESCNRTIKDDLSRHTRSFGMQLQRIAGWAAQDAATSAPFAFYPDVPRNMWRHAQERLQLGLGELITSNVGASLTMWDELEGASAAEKKKSMQVRTYLSIRSDPARASTTLEKELTFDDLTVSSCNFMQTYHISCNFMQTYHTCEGTLSINRGKVSIDQTKKGRRSNSKKKDNFCM